MLLYFALKCSSGWRVWLLHVLNDLYCRFFQRWSSEGKCPYPQDGPALIIANHTSPTDPMLLWTHHNRFWDRHQVRVLRFLMAREYFEQPGVVGWVSRNMGSIPVSRDGNDMAAVREALRCLKNGDIVGIFPEGKLNLTPEQLQPGIPGIAWLALHAGVPVYPIFIQDAPRGTTMVNTFLTRSRSKVIYGEAVDLSRWDGMKKKGPVLEEVTDHLMQALATLGTQCGMLDDSVPQPKPRESEDNTP